MLKLISSAVAVASIMLAAMPSSLAHAEVSDPTRVLIVGDSVTHGRDGDWTWRYFAWKQLTADGNEQRVDFVGPHRGTLGADDTFGGGYADPGFDQDHASRWGLSYWEMLDHGWWPDAQRIDVLIAEEQPDIVVTTLGVNDLMFYNFNAESLSGEVRSFVAEARSADPGIDVVLAGIPQVWIGDAAAFNAGLPALAAELSTASSKVVATPVPTWVQGVDTYDNAHPTRGGEEKLATSVVSVLDSMLPERVPVAPPVPNESPSPTPTPVPEVVTPAATAEPVVVPVTPVVAAAPGVPRVVRAVRSGRKVRVSWRAASGASSYAVRCGSAERATVALAAKVRSSASRCKVRAIGAGGSSSWVAVRVRG